jgi:sodium transport system ATP-binding protein
MEPDNPGRTTPAVAVRGLTKYFHDESRGEVRAVDDVSFECHAGEIFGLLGANGAGKTTTLRILATILKADAGSAALMGHDVTAAPEEVRKNLGFNSATTASIHASLPVKLSIFLDASMECRHQR